MAGYFPQDSFSAAWHEAQKYPSQGTRASNDGVPSRPTLARYSAIDVLSFDPFGDALHSTDKTVLAVMVKLASETEQAISTIKNNADDKNSLRREARQAVYEAYPNAKRVLPDNAFSSPNYAFSTITSLCAVGYNVDPIEAVRTHLGEAKYRD